MITCPNCGEQNPERARFCVACGTPLAAGGTNEERKLVTVVFTELVSGSEPHPEDPEELRDLLHAYQALVSRYVTSHGGTVDKFVGSVALAVFGAPVAHEDDPERGIRSALRLRDAVGELDGDGLSLRAGITTGEAVVARPGTGPQIGEAVTGDVVNIASRLQTAASPGEILVGEPAHRATALVFEWEDHPAVVAKGKAEPLAAWSAVGSRGRFGVDLQPVATTPLIGRREELAVLESAFRRSAGDSSVQLVTITGEAGVGKSRLIQALSEFADEWPGLVRWRQGRSLPFGEGLSFWAMTEIVKADAGILDSDPSDEAARKLHESLEPYLPDAVERDWVFAALAPIAGVETSGVEVPRDELFAAWRRWFEALAEDSPFVVVFEDLQWADDAMLEFVRHLADWSVGLPLLVVCAARPELFERDPSWGGGRRNASAIGLGPLTDQETAMLLGALLEGKVLPAQTQAELIERCGGNPLYAEEFVRMLRDRASSQGNATAPDAQAPMPQRVEILIGARIDTLPPTEREILRDAAVVGKVFWSGALEAVSGLPEDVVVRALHESVRREFVRPTRPSSFRGQQEFAFSHMLVQEVAYGQIPRAARVDKHIAVARWLRAVAVSRVFEIAELLSHHYERALEYARSSDPGADVANLEQATGSALMMAGDRAKRLDPDRAIGFFRRAREVLAADDPERARALLEAAECAEQAGRLDEAERDFDLAVTELRNGGDPAALGEALARGAQSILRFGDAARSLLTEAIEILEAQDPGPELARAYSRMAGHLYVAGDNEGAITWADKAIALSDDLGLDDEAILALQYRGAARSQTGDRAGLDDLREALRRGLELGLGQEVATTYNNLAYELWFWEGPQAATAMWDEMAEFCRTRGFSMLVMWAKAGKLESLFDMGAWDRVVEMTEEMLGWDEAHGPTRVGLIALTYRGWVLVRRGLWDEAAATIAQALPRAREIAYPEYLAAVAMMNAEIALARGHDGDARDALDEFVAATEDHPEVRTSLLPVACRAMVALGAVDAAAELVRRTPEPNARRLRLSVASAEAVVAEAEGLLDEAAAGYEKLAPEWVDYGFGLEEARVRLGLGGSLLHLGRRDEARDELARARALAQDLGAEPISAEVDALLEGVPAP